MITVKKYGAVWCPNCKTLTKILGDKEFEEIDIEQNMEEARELNIKQLPTTIFYKGDEIVERITGLFSVEKFDEIVKKWQ